MNQAHQRIDTRNTGLELGQVPTGVWSSPGFEDT
jgi:hypothetical protein